MPKYRGALLARVYVDVDALSEEEAERKILDEYAKNGYSGWPDPDVVILEKPKGGFADAIVGMSRDTSSC